MKYLLMLVLCIFTLIGMLSCASIPTGAGLPSSDKQTSSTSSITENALDPDTAYAAILTECREILTAPSDSAEYPDELFGIYEAAITFGTEAADTVGYIFRDINADTIPELFIGVFDKTSDAHTKNEIYAAYTHNGSQPVHLFSGWARNSYALTEENTLFHQGSGGAAYSIFGEYAVLETGDFVCKNAYFTYPKEPEMTEIGYYRSTTGIMDPAQAEEWSVTSEEFWALEEALAAKTIVLSGTPLSACTAADPT